ncbi:colicin V production protein [Erythrobacter sp. SG61-1L]|uniref:CvpA family protein n=1 Tax=Erythrobacter sp. SG61-1L TaxID=1603897 RepID=UPI0006C91CF8|nr:CvpA family protein [Erythrobacter sp. SG61-1L]KPL67614.1 colicin V production protein [Erythrobacter sp. SG61-1L]
MTGFDIIVLIIIAVAAIGGFMRGFVQEVLSLASWILALLAIHYLHTQLTVQLLRYVGTQSGAAVLAFTLLLLVPYAAMKLIAGRMGEASRNSLLGPVDRVLGFGFGVVKGGIMVVLAFSVLVLGYDSVWGIQGRPDWITQARSYSAVNAGADALVQMIDSRDREIESSAQAIDGV